MGLGRKLFTLGALAAGAVVGMLFAPKKGSQIRKDLAKEFQKGGYGTDTLKSAVTKMGEDIAQTSKEVYNSEKVQEGAQQIKKVGMEAYEKGKMQASEFTHKAKEQIKSAFTKEQNSDGDEKKD